MLGLALFNAVMILLAAGIAVRIVPPRVYTGLLEALHVTVGITTPAPEKLRIIAVLWIVIIAFLTDALVFIFFLLLQQLR